MLRVLAIILCRFFFRSVNISGTPYTGKSAIWCANHTGAIVDPMVMLGLSPVKLRPIAKHTLWQMSGMKHLLAVVHAIPIKRLQDLKKDSLALSDMLKADIDEHTMQQNSNNEAFQVVCDALLEGGNILIFPEGVSHDSPYIHPLKTGIARMALMALGKAKQEGFSIIIQPVTIDYSEKTEFRSDISIHFCEPIVVNSQEMAVKDIMNAIRDSLEGGIASFFTWDEKRNWRFLFELIYGRPPQSAREFRIFVEDNRVEFDKDPVLLARIQTLRRMMQVIDISPSEMIWGEANQKKRHFFWLLLKYGYLHLFLALPVKILALIVWSIPSKVCEKMATLSTSDRDVLATMKIAYGALIFPLWACGVSSLFTLLLRNDLHGLLLFVVWLAFLIFTPLLLILSIFFQEQLNFFPGYWRLAKLRLFFPRAWREMMLEWRDISQVIFNKSLHSKQENHKLV